MKDVKIVKRRWLDIASMDLGAENDGWNMGTPDIEFIIKKNEWVKCNVTVWLGPHKKIRAIGWAKRQNPDKWDEHIGKEIAFGKAMAHAFSLSTHKIFEDVEYDTNTHRSR